MAAKSGSAMLAVLICSAAYFWLSPRAHAQDTAPLALTLPQPDDPAAAACAPVKSSGNSAGSANFHRSFFDDFLGTSLDSRKWQTHFEGVDNKYDNRTLAGNHEKEIYVDAGYAGVGSAPLGLNPFRLKDGILSIAAARTPAELVPRLYGQPFTSGVITTINSFKQTYGYFEIKAKVPRGKGLWPTFWLLQPKGHWPPEIDMLEIMNGQKPEEILLTTHWKDNGVGAHKQSYCSTKVSGSDTEFHLYGTLWTASRIVYYIDRKPVIQLTTPPGLDQPMYMLANLAVQSIADDSTPSPATFDIDWISAYSQ